MSRLDPSSFLTNLLSALETYKSKPEKPPAESELRPSLPFNLFLSSPQATNFFKPILTTLHLFFPNELLPALDLLDRGLVSRLVRSREAAQPNQNKTTESFYNVRSSAFVNRGQSYISHRQEQDERLQTRTRNLSYEVRLVAWNCTCPAFVFDMVSNLGGSSEWDSDNQVSAPKYRVEANAAWRYGGLRRMEPQIEGERKVPICKHLLACLLVEKCPALRQYVDESEVNNEEIAGWAAGWGD